MTTGVDGGFGVPGGLGGGGAARTGMYVRTGTGETTGAGLEGEDGTIASWADATTGGVPTCAGEGANDMICFCWTDDGCTAPEQEIDGTCRGELGGGGGFPRGTAGRGIAMLTGRIGR